MTDWRQSTRTQAAPGGNERSAGLAKRRKQAQKYLPPDGVRVLFVAEAPPRDLKRYFFFEDVEKHDWLYLALMRQLYDDAKDARAPELRRCKPEFLRRFQADGYFLVDASDEPMPPDSGKKTKQQFLADRLDTLFAKLRGLVSAETRVVLISSAVYAACAAPLKAEGFNVVNKEMIDFPASGRQEHFRRKLGRVLRGFRPTALPC